LTQGRARGLLFLFALAALLCVPASASAINTVSFSPVGNMTSEREAPGAARLPDGRVLVVGGYTSAGGGQYLNTAELFDPNANTFSPLAATMNSIRWGPATATLPDGRVLIAGGYNGSQDVATAEVFNPNSGSFSPVGSMATAREEPGTAPLPDGRILVAGGYSNTGSVNSTEIFDPKTNAFSPGPTFPEAKYGIATAVLSGGRILFAGGYNDSDYVATASVFDPSSNAFAGVASMPYPAYAPVGASLPQGRALVTGGANEQSGSRDEVSTAVIFDPASNTFSSSGIGNLIHKREEAAAVELADGRVLVAGGWDGDAVNTAEVLSVPFNSFKSKLKGQKVTFSITNEGVAQTTDVSTKVATTAKKKKAPKLVKTTSKHGGPGKITVKIKLTKQGNAKLRQKGKLKVRVVYTPDQGLSATKKLKLRAGK
jgi:Kelch motif